MQFNAQVIAGTQHGRTIGYPTLNMLLPKYAYAFFPYQGVYAVLVKVRDKHYNGLLFWGTRSLFAEKKPVCEILLLDFSGDAYNQHIAVSVVSYMRKTMAVTSATQLQTLIKGDIRTARALFLNKKHMIYIGADHGGMVLKEKIVAYLVKKGVPITDMGAHTLKKTDDYPVFAKAVANAVVKMPGSKGIVICRGGNGMAIAANKVKGIRAALAWNESVARASVVDNHANVLALGADSVSEKQNLAIVNAWLSATPSKAARHIRRIGQITNLS